MTISNKFITYLQAREKIYEKLFPYDDVNFGIDPYWLRAYPFRQKALPGSTVEIEARALNHADEAEEDSGHSEPAERDGSACIRPAN